MTTSTTAPPSGATPDDLGPKTLDPRSAAFLVPCAIGVVLMALAYFGIQSIVGATGPWAIQAAQRGLAESGLGAADRAALTAQLERLSKAQESGTIDAQSTVHGVDGLLKDPLFQLLLLDRIRTEQLPPSALDAKEKTDGQRDLAALISYVDAGLVHGTNASAVLGPAAQPGADGAPGKLDDTELRNLLGRARAEIEQVDARKLEAATLVDLDADALLARYAARVDAIVQGS